MQVHCTASCRGKVPQEVSGIESLAGSAESHEDEGLVPVVGDEAVVGLLGNGKDVWGHVLPAATVEHLQHLERTGGWGGVRRWGEARRWGEEVRWGEVG